MKKLSPGLLAGIVAAAVLAAPAFAGPNVTVRVEGQNATLLDRTPVTLPDTDSAICGPGKRWTVADALDLATAGNWDRQALVNTIMGETHTFADSDYWALWNGSAATYRFSMTGVCDHVMAEGEEALFLVDRSPPPDFAPSKFPLGLRGLPAAVQVGSSVSVSVVSFALDGAAAPVAGATVSGGGATATTGADGSAVLTFGQVGAAVVKAAKAGLVVSAGERVNVSAGPVVQPPCATSGSDGRCGTKDSEPPRPSLLGLRNGKVLRHGKGPRVLKGRVSPDPSGLSAVRLSVLRKIGRRCWAFGGDTERFRRHRCGGWRYFKVGDRAEWSYLLPRRLPKGRYTIKVRATDKAANHSEIRVVIRVR